MKVSYLAEKLLFCIYVSWYGIGLGALLQDLKGGRDPGCEVNDLVKTC
jgi:hypothetical protein